MSTIISPDGPALDDRPPFPVRRWSLEEYHSLINQGMFDDEHVELLEGWIVPKMTRNTKHETGRTYLEEQLRPLLGSSMYLRIQQAIQIWISTKINSLVDYFSHQIQEHLASSLIDLVFVFELQS